MKFFPPFEKFLTAGVLSCSMLPLLYAQTGKETHAEWQQDWQILARVQKAFHDDPALAGLSIMPSVFRGAVKLTGTVKDEATKELASSDLADIAGVKTVLNNLNVSNNAQRPAPTPTQVAPAGPSGSKTVTLAAGTTIPVRITDEIDTKTAKANDTFHGTTAASVVQSGYTLIPSGTPVIGRVADAKAAGHFTGTANLSLELVSVKLPGASGTQDISIVTEALSSQAQGRGTNTAEKTGGGAAVGAVIGALAGGGKGAGIGAASGGALGAGTNAITRGKEIDLKPEQLLRFRTSAPLEVTVLLQNGHQVPSPSASAPALETRPDGSQGQPVQPQQ